MASEKKKTAAELEAETLKQTCEAAREKLKAGKKLTKSDFVALKKEEWQTNIGVTLATLQSMPKGEFREIFGGNPQTWTDWERDLGCPWSDAGKKNVNAIAVIGWMRDTIANRHALQPGDPAADFEARYKRARAERAELELARERGESIPLTEVMADVDVWASKIREAADVIGRLHPESQKVLVEKLAEVETEIAERIEHGSSSDND